MEPGHLGGARQAVQGAGAPRAGEDAAQQPALPARVPLLLVQLLAGPADDRRGGHSGRAGGHAVVAGEAGGERAVGDLSQLEATLHRVPDQGDPAPRRLPLHGVDLVRGADRLAERALVTPAHVLVDVREEAGGGHGRRFTRRLDRRVQGSGGRQAHGPPDCRGMLKRDSAATTAAVGLLSGTFRDRGRMVSAGRGHSALSLPGLMPLASPGQGSNVETDGWSEAPHRQEVWT